MNTRLRTLFSILAGLFMASLLLTPASLQAQQTPPMTIKVQVNFDHIEPETKENIPVFLKAARVKGPFEPTDPPPVKEWTGLTNAQGEAVFKDVPTSLATQGLRLQAVASYDDSLFKSPQIAPTNNLRIKVPIYERGFDLSTLRVQSVRMVIEPWEDYLVYTQMWTLGVEGSRALDTTLIPSPDFKDGIPIELPLKARGINYNGADGQHKIINSTVYWKGIIKPGQPISFQLRYSIPIKDTDFVYAQDLDYTTQKLEIIIPLQTNYKNKLPRLNNLEFNALGFKPEDIQSGFNIPGLRPDAEFIYATRRDIPTGEGIKIKLSNLPYGRPIGPWIALGFGLLGILIVMLFAVRERRSIQGDDRVSATVKVLERELSSLYSKMAELDALHGRGQLTQEEYEHESMLLRTRTGLILKNLDHIKGVEHATSQA